MLIAIWDFIYVLNSEALQGFSKCQRSHFTPVIPTWGLLRQENCHNLKASLGYIVRPCLNKPKRTTENNHRFQLVFYDLTSVYAKKQFFLSGGGGVGQSNPMTFFANVKPRELAETSSCTSLNGSSDNFVPEHGECKWERWTQGYFFLEMQRRWGTRNIMEEDNWLADSLEIWIRLNIWLNGFICKDTGHTVLYPRCELFDQVHSFLEGPQAGSLVFQT